MADLGPVEGSRRLRIQIEGGRKLLAGETVSKANLHAWTRTTEELLGRIYGPASSTTRSLKSAQPTIRPSAYKNDQEMAAHLKETLGNRVTLVESLTASLDEDARSDADGDANVVLQEPNRVIVSWSGATSRKIAEFLYEWWPKVVPGIKPWVSFEDIAKGKRWFDELMSQLGKSTTCLICVTPENHKAPWVYYEAGVIAAKQTEGNVCTVLFGVTTRAIEKTPLEAFMATVDTREDMARLARDLNRGLSEGQVSAEALREGFEKHWAELESEIADVLRNSVAATETVGTIDLTSEYQLSDDAKNLLRAAASSTDGQIIVHNHDGGRDFLIGGKDFVNDASPRAQARWKSAFDELFSSGLIGHFRRARDVFEVTHAGFTVYDSL